MLKKSSGKVVIQILYVPAETKGCDPFHTLYSLIYILDFFMLITKKDLIFTCATKSASFLTCFSVFCESCSLILFYFPCLFIQPCQQQHYKHVMCITAEMLLHYKGQQNSHLLNTKTQEKTLRN